MMNLGLCDSSVHKQFASLQSFRENQKYNNVYYIDQITYVFRIDIIEIRL